MGTDAGVPDTRAFRVLGVETPSSGGAQLRSPEPSRRLQRNASSGTLPYRGRSTVNFTGGLTPYIAAKLFWFTAKPTCPRESM